MISSVFRSSNCRVPSIMRVMISLYCRVRNVAALVGESSSSVSWITMMFVTLLWLSFKSDSPVHLRWKEVISGSCCIFVFAATLPESVVVPASWMAQSIMASCLTMGAGDEGGGSSMVSGTGGGGRIVILLCFWIFSHRGFTPLSLSFLNLSPAG
ncbi:OLC1v1030463C1 [Oldenlandia corymbosa var. corymbosa]|uniref:OLC1v1030463C1 n=1 Tax=Oldenlandia corymbosa var. corymbosa TaxID=529605 RepID=A0AAV1CGY7_OLDCO|nr:OLC1v1030463C1 [Oldenlandia corymbosa var. corymbosa]